MRLKREVSRTNKAGRTYHKWRVTLPEDSLRELGWKDGDELEPTVENGALVLRRTTDRKG